jgi:hypothetical protein
MVDGGGIDWDLMMMAARLLSGVIAMLSAFWPAMAAVGAAKASAKRAMASKRDTSLPLSSGLQPHAYTRIGIST